MDNKTVLKVLQLARTNGIAMTYSHWAGGLSGLRWWQRFINWLLWWADNKPFIDPWNYRELRRHPIGAYVNMEKLEAAMKELCGTPTCRICGSTNLDADPSGYYEDATTWDGAPLLCRDCEG